MLACFDAPVGCAHCTLQADWIGILHEVEMHLNQCATSRETRNMMVELLVPSSMDSHSKAGIEWRGRTLEATHSTSAVNSKDSFSNHPLGLPWKLLVKWATNWNGPRVSSEGLCVFTVIIFMKFLGNGKSPQWCHAGMDGLVKCTIPTPDAASSWWNVELPPRLNNQCSCVHPQELKTDPHLSLLITPWTQWTPTTWTSCRNPDWEVNYHDRLALKIQ